MLTDIIIPAYNCSETIDYLLASIAMQRMKKGNRYKVTVVDDCSTDGFDFEAMADYWSCLIDIKVIHRKKNGGCGQARQTGFDKTKGDYVIWADADDCFVSPYAIDTLMTEAKANDCDIIVGQFAEETDTGVVLHDMNWTWMHGKMYKRNFLKNNKLRFNKTRGNEDVGFNVVASKLTEKIKYIPQIVYSWNNNKNSTVRSDFVEYRCGSGWRDFLENLSWAAEELMSRGVEHSVIAEYSADIMGRLYFQYMESYIRLPEQREANEAKLKDFYQRAIMPYVTIGLITYSDLQKAYYAYVQEDGKLAIPQMTFREWLDKLGIIDDLRIVEEAFKASKEVDNGNNRNSDI